MKVRGRHRGFGSHFAVSTYYLPCRKMSTVVLFPTSRMGWMGSNLPNWSLTRSLATTRPNSKHQHHKPQKLSGGNVYQDVYKADEKIRLKLESKKKSNVERRREKGEIEEGSDIGTPLTRTDEAALIHEEEEDEIMDEDNLAANVEKLTEDSAQPITMSELQVRHEERDMRLDRWLKLQFPTIPNSMFQKLIRKRKILVNSSEGDLGGKLEGNYHVKPGDVVKFPSLLSSSSSSSANSSREFPQYSLNDLTDEEKQMVNRWVLYKDVKMIAINKPSGLAVQGGTDLKDNHLLRLLPALQEDYADPPRLVHRLDKEASGVLLLGRTRADAAHLTALFRQKRVIKHYWAILSGRPTPRAGRITTPLKDTGQNVIMLDKMEAGAKMAVTRYKTLCEAGDIASFVSLWPWTGRKHQLRVHCASALKAPILGDARYGPDAGYPFEAVMGKEERETLQLHCRAIEIPHPFKEGRRLRIQAAPPPHMLRALNALDFDEEGDV
jgi:23S rRNA pseudouridine955/2504/2580 synthase